MLGVVEGVTEYLPVSSTGHLTVVERAMGIGDTAVDRDAADSYAIAIQLGAILAVVGLYRRRLSRMAAGIVGRDAEGRRLSLAVALAFLPAAAVGLVLGDLIKERLFGTGPVIAAWLVGGVVILAAARARPTGGRGLSALTYRDAAIIGVAQCFALWPGISRSLVTILAATVLGLALPAAVEFSFLLGLVTLGAATSYEIVSNGGTMVDAFGYVTPLVGVAAAFVSACAAIAWMVVYLNRHGMAVFGYYRLGIGALVSLLVLVGVI